MPWKHASTPRRFAWLAEVAVGLRPTEGRGVPLAGFLDAGHCRTLSLEQFSDPGRSILDAVEFPL
jgi:hypothetical protein